ncbi:MULTISPECIES: thioredoxin [Methanoculleus]|jgi:thioredoxin 1|uniref:Thioredoxin n=1 Tax=Methanoculleus thermophilus TaxID=2200 RepID=A0A1G9A9H7_9EURY|nr:MULTISPECIES: thioredoxin [Methanoculleus]NLN09035.1 thioredoxin [Methanoculleus thermophilus]SDK23913.1 thioredoxin [Methanoculleus thermophilus]HQD27126.1 thioredoxin [Methanoculleus thermophilus]
MVEREPTDDELQRLREERLREMEARLLGKQAGVIEITDDTFQKTIRDHPFVVVDVWAEWCGPCRMVAPIIEELARDFAGRVTFCKCNVDQNSRVAMRFGISAIPTLLFFANGALVDRVVGALPKETIRSKVARAFEIG